ncbi:uncharacterized protein [Ptychodera flava]|uniref:uncharacterized protein n=1 Tax=Ptychodera flava TaxID=63121 RepID=UPI00396A3CA1
MDLQVSAAANFGNHERLVAGKSDSISSDCINKWVKNCSSRVLTDTELSVLAKGLNYAVTPKEIPVVDIISATESACRTLPDRDGSELRSKVTNLLSRPKKLESNLTVNEWKALDKRKIRIFVFYAQIKENGCCVRHLRIPTECEQLLSDTNTFRKLGTKDPTSKYKKELVSVLQEVEKEGGINREEYRKLYPTTETPPKFYGLPKVRKQNTPLRPIISSAGTITYNCAKLVADVLSPSDRQTDHHVVNSQHFAKCMQNRRVEEDEELRSYDVTALFTSVPVDKAIGIIHNNLEKDITLDKRTRLSIAIATAPHPPLWWFRYVDDTHTKLKKCHAQEFTDHLNTLDPDIKFTTEGEENRSLAFLDTLSVVQVDGSINLKSYRKPTHTDQYLNFTSNRPLQHKLGVIQTLFHRAESVTDATDCVEEKQHITQALAKCGYPSWTFNRVSKQSKPKATTSKAQKDFVCKGQIVLPYVKGISEALKRTFNSYGIMVCFKPNKTLRQLQVASKDKTAKKDITGPVYMIPCQDLELATFFERLKAKYLLNRDEISELKSILTNEDIFDVEKP